MSAYDWTAIRAAYEGGASLYAIKARFGCDVPHTSRKLRRMGVTMRPRGRPTKARDRLVALLATNAGTLAEIAERCGVSESTVSRTRAELRHSDRLVEVRW